MKKQSNPPPPEGVRPPPPIGPPMIQKERRFMRAEFTPEQIKHFNKCFEEATKEIFKQFFEKIYGSPAPPVKFKKQNSMYGVINLDQKS